MKLIGLILWNLTLSGKEERGAFVLDPNSPNKVIATHVNPKSQIGFDTLMQGIKIIDGEVSMSRIVGEKYGLELSQARKYTPNDGVYFLLALMTHNARGTYSYFEPVEQRDQNENQLQ